MKTNRRILSILFVALFALMSLSAAGKGKVKYVFYMIGDGMGVNQVYSTGVYNQAVGGSVVNFTEFPYFTTISTVSASSRVTDSAAAGTALASGVKTDNGRLGTDPSDKPVVTVADMAKEAGWGVGLVTSVGVNHATPGAFYAKVASRNMYDEINQNLIDSKVDYAAGATFLSNMKENAGPKYWASKAEEAGIHMIYGPNAYKPVDGRVIHLAGLTGPDSLPYAIDRKPGDTQLSDFTKGAIEHLYSHYAKKGFFLMVEGGKIDYACHDDDAATTFQELNDFANTIDVVLDFYRQHKDETLIIVTADHETGGLSIGNGLYELHEDIMHNQKASLGAINAKLMELRTSGNNTWEAVKEVFSQTLGLWTNVPVTEPEEAVLREMFERAKAGSEEQVRSLYALNSRLADSAMRLLTRKAMFSWISGAHSGSPVGCWTIGAKAETFTTCRDNTDVPKTLEKAMGLIK